VPDFVVEKLNFCRPFCSPSVAKGTTIIVLPIFRLIKKCQANDNRWLVEFLPVGETGFEQGAPAPQPNQPEKI
jgi:hypothetical protein